MLIGSRRVKGTLCAAAGLLMAVLAPAQQPVQRLSRVPASGETRVALRDSAGTHAARAQQLGALAGDTALTSLSLVLKPTAAQDAALTQLLADQQNPASASYQQWLTPEQFGERFGAAQADINLIESWLRSNGFVVQSVPASRNRIVFSGTAAAVESAFRTPLQRYRRDGREFYENSVAVQLPQSLAAVVSGVSGLSSYRLAAPQVHRLAQVKASPEYTTSTGAHYLVPDDLRTIYGTKALLSSGYNGSGIKIGIIGQSAVDTTQLTYFQQKTGQTLNLPTMVLVPNTGNSNKVSGDELESELDLEYAGGNAPGASVQFIYTGCTSTTTSSPFPDTGNCNNDGVFGALVYAITNNLAPILSLSYGSCEGEIVADANTILEPALKQANAQGQTIMVASGDHGAASCDTSYTATVARAGLAVSYPASSQYVTGVGGTQLSSDSSTYWTTSNDSSLGSAITYVPETSWNDSLTQGQLAASGGGVSQIFAKPSWQVGTGVPADSHRDVPDVAFPANVTEHPYLTCDAERPCTSGTKSFTLTGSTPDGDAVGGTSAGAPTFAGMLAVVEQANGGRALGNVNPSLYALAQGTSKSTIFHDITTGNNIVSCTIGTPNCITGTLGYSAGVGYDQVTGLGSLDIPSLRTALAGYAAGTPRIALAVPSSISAGTAVTFTATLSGSGAIPTGTVAFSVDGTVVSSAQTLSSGTATYSYSGFTSNGSHTVSVAYSGDGTYSSGTASATVTVTAITPTLTLTANPASPATGTAVTFTATLSSTGSVPTGSVVFTTDDGGTSGSVPLTSGSATYTYAGFTTAGLHVVTAAYTPSASAYTAASMTTNVVVTGNTQTMALLLQLLLSTATVAPGGSITASVTTNGIGGTPTGRVAIAVDGSTTSTILLSGGSGTLTLTAPATTGSHTVLATYYGDNTYKTATATATFTVASPGIGVAVSPTTLTATYGSNATGTLTVTSASGAAGTTSFALSLVSYTGATFTGCYGLSSRTVSLASNSSVADTLTLYTTASSCTSAGLTPLSASALPATSTSTAATGWGNKRYSLAVLPLPMLLLLLYRRRVPAALLAMVSLACVLGIVGCGSSSTGTTTTTTTGTGTGTTTTTTSGNSGTYVIRVSASTAATSGTLTSSTTFTLNVQ